MKWVKRFPINEVHFGEAALQRFAVSEYIKVQIEKLELSNKKLFDLIGGSSITSFHFPPASKIVTYTT